MQIEANRTNYTPKLSLDVRPKIVYNIECLCSSVPQFPLKGSYSKKYDWHVMGPYPFATSASAALWSFLAQLTYHVQITAKKGF